MDSPLSVRTSETFTSYEHPRCPSPILDHSLEQMFIEYAHNFALRIAKVDSLDLNHTFEVFKAFPRVVVSEEGTGVGLHHHVFVSSSSPIQREELVVLIKSAYPAARGNKCIYVRPAVNSRQLLKYTLKEGHYLYKGFTSKYIKDMEALSSPKTDIKAQMSFLEDQLIMGKIGLCQFMRSHIELKVEHQQNIYESHLHAYFTRMALRVGKLDLEDYVVRFENKIFE